MRKSEMIGRTRFHIEHQSKLRRSLASSDSTSRSPSQTSAPSIDSSPHHEKEPLRRRRWRALSSYDNGQEPTRGSTNFVSWRTSFTNEYEWSNRHPANATYLEINVRATSQHQVDRQTDISGRGKNVIMNYVRLP